MRLAIREIQLVVQLVILVLHTHHLHQVEVGRTSSYHTVDKCITSQFVIHQQRVRS